MIKNSGDSTLWHQRSKNSMILNEKSGFVAETDIIFESTSKFKNSNLILGSMSKCVLSEDGQQIFIVNSLNEVKQYSMPLKMFLGDPIFYLEKKVKI